MTFEMLQPRFFKALTAVMLVCGSLFSVALALLESGDFLLVQALIFEAKAW